MYVADQILIQRVKEYRDRNAFTTLYNRYYNVCMRYLIKHFYNFVNEDDADDILQNVFTGLWNKPYKYNSQKGTTFNTWFYTVITNEALSYYRKKRLSLKGKNTVLLDNKLPDSDNSFENVIVDPQLDIQERYEFNELIQLINEAIHKMSYRKTDELMHLLDGSNYIEISEIREIPKGTVKSRIFRARQSIREYLEQRYDYELPAILN